MKRKVLVFFASPIIVLTFTCLSWAWSGKVVDVAEGDTITVLRNKEQVRIRLYGIECPERGQPFSRKAKQFTAKMVFGKVVEVGAITIDHHGITIALVYVEGASLNGRLIRAGLAWVYYLYCNLPICREWKNLESEAKEAKRGVWGDTHAMPLLRHRLLWKSSTKRPTITQPSPRLD